MAQRSAPSCRGQIAPWYMANEPYGDASYYEGIIIWVIDHDHITLLPHGPTVLNQAASEDPSPPYSHSVEPEEDIVRVSIDSYGGNWVNRMIPNFISAYFP
jgi:hypothetical protein